LNTPQPELNTPQPELNTPQPELNTPQPELNTPQPGLTILNYYLIIFMLREKILDNLTFLYIQK